MNNSVLIKAGMVTLSTGGAAGGGYLIYPLVFSKTKKTLLDKLRSKNKSPIESNEHQWTLRKDIYNKSPNQFKITIEGIEKTNITVGELKNWCSNSLKETYSEEKDSTFLKVEKWCSKPSIREALSKENKEIIPILGTPIDSAWGTKLTTHASDVKGDLIDKWKLPSKVAESNQVDQESLRNVCRRKIEEEYLSDQNDDYTLSKKWCLRP